MKHTKRLLAAVMALSMVSAIAPMSAFADTEIKPDTVPPEGGLTVKYDVDPSYTVTIPAGVDITTGDKTASITLDEGALLAEGTKIEVVLEKGAYTTTGNAFTAKTASGNSSASYQINGGNVKVGDVVASLDKDTLSADLTFSRTTTIAPTYAGTHSEVLTFNIAVEDSFESVLAPALENGATVVIAYRWNGYNTTTFTFTNNGGTYSCNVGGDEASDFSGSLTLNGTTLALSITNSVMSSRINLAISFDTTNDTYSFVTKGSWYNSHTVSVNGTNITDKLTAKN